MGVTVLPAPESARPVLENLASLYIYDFTEFSAEEIDEQGRYELEYLDRYWSEPNRFPFIIRVEGKLAGFALVRVSIEADGLPLNHMAEFFILRSYRRQNAGRRAACELFDRFPGRWWVAQMPENLPAQQFWRAIIGEYTGGAFEEITIPEWDGPIQEFTSIKRNNP